MKEMNACGYPTQPINIFKIFKPLFSKTKEILSSKIILFILPIIFFDALAYKLTPNFINDINNIEPAEAADFLINFFNANFVQYSITLLISFLTFFLNIILILAMDNFIREKKINFSRAFETAGSKFFQILMVSLISISFAYIPVILIVFKISNSNPALFFGSIFISFFATIALFFAKLIIIIKNISIIDALKASWKLIGYKYFIGIAIFNVIYGKIYMYNLEISNNLSDYPPVITILTLMATNLLLLPFFNAFKLFLFNDLTLRRAR